MYLFTHHRLILLSLCFIGISFATHGQSVKVDLASGITAYYPFTNKSLESQVSGATRALAVSMDWKNNRFGDSESALTLNGQSSYLRIPSGDGVNISEGSGYSVSLWLRPMDENQGCILLKEGDYGIKWNGLDQPLTVFDGLLGGFPTGYFSSWRSQEWYHVTLVRNERERSLSLYINGELDRTWEASAKETPADQDLFIGKHPYFWGGFTGQIDDVALYQRPLHKLEILTLSQIENIPLTEVPIQSQEAEVELRDFLGTWSGVITQPENELVPNYSFWLHFTEIENGLLKGYSRIEVPEDDAFGVTQVQAIISGNRLNFEEIRVYRQKNYLGYKWCKKYGQLKLDEGNLSGKWYANNCQQTGNMLLLTTESGFNYHDNRLSPKISLEEILCQLEESTTGNGQVQMPLTEAVKVTVEPIQFGFGNAVISEASKQYLSERFIPILKSMKGYELTITGYTDSSGSDEINLILSRERAKAIYQFLISQQIPADVLQYVGKGEANPVADNSTSAGRKMNRRVEFELSKASTGGVSRR